jgi:hypothetical protein
MPPKPQGPPGEKRRKTSSSLLRELVPPLVRLRGEMAFLIVENANRYELLLPNFQGSGAEKRRLTPESEVTYALDPGRFALG